MATDSTQRGSGQGVPRVTRSTPKEGRQLQIMVRGRPLTVERLRRIEKRARRAARARRRFIVSIVLLLGSVLAWTLVGFGQVHWGVAVVPSAMLLFVLFLGQRAARAARRADARWHAAVRTARQQATQARALANGGPYAPRNRAQITGRATYGSDTATQAIPRVSGAARGSGKNVLDEILDGTSEPKVVEAPVEAGAGAGAGGDGVEPATAPGPVDRPPSGRAWDPVPVPLPTYVTKPAAPPRQPAALPSFPPRSTAAPQAGAAVPGAAGAVSAGAGSAGAASAGAAGSAQGASAEAAAVAEDELLHGAPPRMKSETLATPLEEILARRRAAG